MDKNYFIYKLLFVIFSISGLYVLIMIVLGTIQLFGNNVFAEIIGLPIICLNCYVYAQTYINIIEKDEKENKQ